MSSKTLYNREYYEKNKEETKKKNQVIIGCECGCFLMKRNFNKHLTTRMHKERLMEIEQSQRSKK